MPVKAITLPVADCLSMPWADLCSLLARCWEEATALANWTARELDRLDVIRLPGMARLLPPPPPVPETEGGAKVLRGLYGLASLTFDFRGGFWKGAANSASSIIRAVERKYRRERRAIVWDGDRTSARYRYPHPFPVHARCWEASFTESGAPMVVWSAPGGKRVTLKLRAGPEFARQLADFRRVASGASRKCQLLITCQYSHSPHRRTLPARDAGGGRVRCRVTVKLVIDAPAVAAPEAGRVLTLCTDPEALWVAELDGRRAWLVNADHILGAVAMERAYKARLQRQSEDRKAEGRASRKRRRLSKSRLDKLAVKFARRRKSWVQETVAHLIKFCKRQGVAAVLYRDKANGSVPLPWLFALNERLRQCCKAEGIRLRTQPGAEGAA